MAVTDIEAIVSIEATSLIEPVEMTFWLKNRGEGSIGYVNAAQFPLASVRVTDHLGNRVAFTEEGGIAFGGEGSQYTLVNAGIVVGGGESWALDLRKFFDFGGPGNFHVKVIIGVTEASGETVAVESNEAAFSISN